MSKDIKKSIKTENIQQNDSLNVSSKYAKAKISPRKVVDVVAEIRNKPAGEAMNYLKFNPRKAANLVHGVLKSALANAFDKHNLDTKDLYIKEVHVGPGPTRGWRRFAAKGRIKPIKKRTSNITVVLGAVNSSKKQGGSSE